jgi:hypothetical protein
MCRIRMKARMVSHGRCLSWHGRALGSSPPGSGPRTTTGLGRLSFHEGGPVPSGAIYPHRPRWRQQDTIQPSVMKNPPRSRVFITVCWIYLFSVGAAFLFGLLFKDDHGVSFMPVLVLTSPWTHVMTKIARSLWLFPALTAYYDLPLFAISAFLNVSIAEGLRRLRTRASEGFVSIAPR